MSHQGESGQEPGEPRRTPEERQENARRIQENPGESRRMPGERQENARRTGRTPGEHQENPIESNGIQLNPRGEKQ